MPHALSLDPASFGRRLSERMQERGWGYEDFHRRVREAAGGARGSSYGSVWAYVNGRVSEPRPAVVRAMADVLGVTYEWLVTGRGPRTIEDAARDAAADDAVEADRAPAASPQRGPIDRMARLLGAMEDARRRMPPETTRLVGRNARILEQLVIDLLESDGQGLDRYAEGEVAEATRLMTWLVTLPLTVFGSEDLPERRDPSEAYVLAMSASLRLALPESPRGRPRNVLDRLRRLRSRARTEAIQTALDLPDRPSRH